MRLLLPLPLIDSGMVKITRLHYSMGRLLNLGVSILMPLNSVNSVLTGVHFQYCRSTFCLEYLHYRSTFSTVGVLVLFLKSITWSKGCSLTEIDISENHAYQWVVCTEINISEIMCIVL